MPELAKSQTSLGLKDGSSFAPVPERVSPESRRYMLEVRNVVKRYGSIIAVNGVTFCVAYGEIFGLLDPNGAGKTTTIRPPARYPIIWEELISWRSKFWLYLATYMLSPLIFLLSFGFGVGQRLKLMMPGGVSYLEFLIPGVVALALFNNGVTSVIIRMFYTRLYSHSFEAYRLAPVGTFSLWIGYALAGMLRGLLAGFVFLVMVLFLVPTLQLSWPFFWSMALASFCFGSFGVLIGLYLRSFYDQALVSELILVPMTFLSGTLIPVERLPGLLQPLVWLFPLTPAT